MRCGLRVLILLVCVAAARPSYAELVFLSSGRSLSVRSYRVDGGTAILSLRAGGEVVCDWALIARIEPDEVPYPDAADASTIDPAPTIHKLGTLIDETTTRYGVSADLVRALIQVESAYDPSARSRRGAAGLMQLMPDTARQYAVVDPFDPKANLDAGVRHLKSLLDRFGTPLALAAYNAGEGAVRAYGGIPPYRETRDYVARVLKLARRSSARP